MPTVSATKPKTNGKPGPKHNIDAVREAFYERISKRDLAPLWKVMSSVVTKEPVTRVRAARLALQRREVAGDGIGRPDHAPRKPSAAC